MKKFTIAALALAMSFCANAQQAGGSGAQAGSATLTAGGISVTVATVTVVGVAAAVAASIINNAKDSGLVLDPEKEFILVCEDESEPVDGVCTYNSTTVIVTGTGTATSTISVPVVTTGPAILVPKP